MNSLLFLLILDLFGFSQIECDICGWPYRTGVNSEGKCYVGQGLQAGLEGGCYVWCDAWARQSGVSQPATPVLTFWQDAGGAICKCQRLERDGGIGYNTRPTAACEWGYSNEVKDYYDSVAVNKRSETLNPVNISGQSPVISDLNDYYNTVDALQKQFTSAYGVENVYTSTCGDRFVAWGQDSRGVSSTVIVGSSPPDYVNNFVYVPLPNGYTCSEYHSGKMAVDAGIKPILEHISSQDTAIRRVNEAVETIQKSVGSNNASIMDELGKILSKPTGGANLNPVLDAIQSMRESQSTQLNRIDSSFSAEIENLTLSFETTLHESLDSLAAKFGSDSGSKGTDVSGIEKRQDTTNIRLKSGFQNLGDSVSGMKKGIANLDSTMRKNTDMIYRIDSGNQANRIFDRLEDSLAYQKVKDSMANKDSYKAQAEQGIQDAQGFAIQGETNATGLKTSLQGWQTLPGTCSDAPTWEIDLSSANLGKLQINFNQYPWLPAFSRVGMRVAGLLASLLIVLKAMELLGYSNAKKD